MSEQVDEEQKKKCQKNSEEKAVVSSKADGPFFIKRWRGERRIDLLLFEFNEKPTINDIERQLKTNLN